MLASLVLACHVCLVSLACLLMMAVSLVARADDRFGAFCGARDEIRLLRDNPVSSMDDAELFFAAQAIRTRRMSAAARAINYYWLHQDAHNTLSGSKALGKILRLGALKIMRKSDTDQEHESDSSSDFALNAFSVGESDYSVRASSDGVAIHFELIF